MTLIHEVSIVSICKVDCSVLMRFPYSDVEKSRVRYNDAAVTCANK